MATTVATEKYINRINVNNFSRMLRGTCVALQKLNIK
jgi:hypothetical protein